MSGDLSVAQDYENYLNNREAINALIAANPDSAFTAGWIATFARVNELGLNHTAPAISSAGWSAISIRSRRPGSARPRRSTVGAATATASSSNQGGERRRGSGLALGVRRPDQCNQRRHRPDRAVPVFSGLAARAFNGLGAALGRRRANDLWFGATARHSPSPGTGGDDILVGGAMNDVIYGGAGWDFVDGGAGNDHLFGQDGGDILRGGRGTDFLYGSSGNDTYAFARGDGVDRILDDTSGTVFVPDLYGTPGSGHYEVQQLDAGSDTLAFGPGIAVSDVAMAFTGSNNDLMIVVKDPAHPGVSFWDITDRITVQNGANPKNAIEKLAFADGTTLDIGAARDSYLVPFGEALSRSSVAENSAIGTVVGTVTASDLDAADVLTYSLRDDVTGGRFAINASTGAITVTGALNFEGTNAWPIVVRVSDQTGHVYDHAFVINVTNVNEAPTGIALSGNSIAENSPGGTVIGTAAASDPDAGTVLRYSLLDDAGGRFYISPSSGVIVNVSSQTINYEGTPAWPIVVRAADQYGQVVDRPFVINVTNIDEPTTDITLSNSSVAENSTLGTVIGTAHGNDPDAGTLYSYSLTGDVTGGRFAINASSGIISVAGSLNFEGTPAWPITVRATDQAGHVFDKPLVINVTNVNEAPTDITLAGNSILENSPGGTIVGTAHGIDPDAGAVFNYSLLDDAGGRFFIYPTSGIVVNVSSQTIDYEAAHSHAIMVRTTDQNGLAFDKSFAIALGNVNDNAPVVSVPQTNVTAAAGQLFAASSLFSASDADGDALTWFIYDWTPAAGSGHFVVNGSVVPAQTVVGLTPSDFAHTSFVAGSPGSNDDLGVMVFDGHDYSGNTSFNGFHVLV